MKSQPRGEAFDKPAKMGRDEIWELEWEAVEDSPESLELKWAFKKTAKALVCQ